MSQINTYNPDSHSLRRRYLLASGLIAVTVLGVSLVATQYVEQVNQRNSRSLLLVDTLNQELGRIRLAIRQTETSIQDQVSSPSENQQKVIISHLHEAQEATQHLRQAPILRNTAWLPRLKRLQNGLATFDRSVRKFIHLRKDPDWIYPALPYINDTLLHANTGFEQQLTLAISETEAQLPDPQQVAIYQRLVSLRDQWRRMILNFRAVMIRFAGLPDIDPRPEEHNIELLFHSISAELTRLNANPDGLPYGLQTEDSLHRMQQYAAEWRGYFQQVKMLRAKGQWRGDVSYIDQHLRPIQRALEVTLDQLTQRLQHRSADATMAAGDAAGSVNTLLWVMSVIGLMVIVLLYVSLEHSLLRPVARVANALAEAARGQQSIVLPPQSNREIAILIDAFEHMHRQVQGRQQSLEFLALHDVLTSLPNRALLADRLEQGMAVCRRKGCRLALLLLDLDRFKEINDSLGHQVGDRVLQEVSHRLQPLLRDADTVARLGGDEFALVAPDVTREDTVTLARRIHESLLAPYHYDGQSLYVGASIGIAMSPEDGDDADTLLRRADGAMYAAKRNNLDYAFFDLAQDRELAESMLLLAQLRDALSRGKGLRLYYQPKASMLTGGIIGAEALLRWHLPDSGWIPPERVVKIAENANLIRTLTDWVLDQAVSDCARAVAANMPINIAVNLSARDLQDETLPDVVAATLARHGVPAHYLTLEITENAVMGSPERARQVLMRLADQGITLSIDDFGTGYSSLAHLKLLRVHELKIDKSFVLNMRHNESDAVIVRSTIDLGHNLSLQVVAEGVEDQATSELLRARRCDVLQGALISHAVPFSELLNLVRRRAA